MISYAQNFEDVMLWRGLGHVPTGCYIDIGAQDPVVDSVSLAFYEQGWRGIHVEPTPAYASMLRAARPDETVVQAAIGEHDGLIPFFEIAQTGISTGAAAIAEQHATRGFDHKRVQVPCIRLSALLDSVAERDVHWMKIDVEGMEASVLRSWAPSPVRPWVVVVESTLPLSREQSHAEWEGIVLGLGYRFCHFDGLNRYYVAEEHPELFSALELPPNVFDQFVLAGSGSHSFCAQLNQSIAEARHDAETSRAMQLALENRLQAAEDAIVSQHQSHEQRLAEEAEETERRLREARNQQALLAEREAEVSSALAELAAARSEAKHLQSELSRQRTAAEARFEAQRQTIAAIAQSALDAERLRQQDHLSHLVERERDLRAELAADHARRLESARAEDQEQSRLRMQEQRESWCAAAVERESDLQQRIMRAESEAAQARDLLTQQRAELDRLQNRLGVAEALQQERGLGLERAHSDLDRARLELASARAEAARLQAQQTELSMLHQEATARLAQQEHDHAQLRAEAAAERVQAAQRNADLLYEGRALAQRLEEARSEHEIALEQTRIQYRQAATRLAEQERDHLQRLADAEAGQVRAAHESASLLRERRAFEQQLVEAKSEAAQFKARSAELEMHLARVQAQARRLQTHFSDHWLALDRQLEAVNRTGLHRWMGAFGRRQGVRLYDPPHFAETPGAQTTMPVDPSAATSDFDSTECTLPLPQLISEDAVLEELLVLNDIHFVRASYRLLLKRDTDPDGELTYLNHLRSGRDKILLLEALSRSDEAQRIGSELPGLQRALRLRQISRIPVIGPLVSRALGLVLRSRPYDPLSAYQSQSIGMHHATLRMMSDMQTSLLRLSERQARFEDSLGDITARQAEATHVLRAVEGRLNRPS